MNSSEVMVGCTAVGNHTLVACSACGPVAVTDLDVRDAALQHLAVVHDINKITRVEK